MISVEKNSAFTRFLSGSLVAGVVAAVLNNLYNLIYLTFSDLEVGWVINFMSITLSTMILILMGGIFYFILSRFTSKATNIYVVVAVIFTILSCVGPLLKPELPDGSPAPEGFFGLVLPMHFIAGICAVVIQPYFVKKNKF